MKFRLDELLVVRNLADDLQVARALIGAGEVFVDDQRIDKAGRLVGSEVRIRLKARCPYVSRGGLKLQAGLDHFDLDVSGWICLDIGASSGGFTDCLLQREAAKVFAVDVAYGQLDWKLRQDPRVVIVERFNARKLTTVQVPETIDLAVFDASFISLKKLIPVTFPFFRNTIRLLALIKPQFELPKEKIGKGGVVTEAFLHEEALDDIRSFAKYHHLKTEGVIASPIFGPKGNKEFLIYLTGDSKNEPNYP